MTQKPANRHFCLTFSQVFGSRNAPLNFSRHPAWACQVMASLIAVPMTHCVDDVIVIEDTDFIDSGREAWFCIMGLLVEKSRLKNSRLLRDWTA